MTVPSKELLALSQADPESAAIMLYSLLERVMAAGLSAMVRTCETPLWQG